MNANEKQSLPSTLAGRKLEKVPVDRVFPVDSLAGILANIRRAGGTGKLEINFRDGKARGEAKWSGVEKQI